MNRVPVLKVAELPTCQTTWHGSAPLSRSTRLFDAVITVEAAWLVDGVGGWSLGLPAHSRSAGPGP